VVGVRGETRIDDFIDLAVGFQIFSNGLCVFSVSLHTDFKGHETTTSEVTIESGRNSTERVLHESELGVPFFVVGDSNTHHDIRVAVDVLGNRVNDDIGAQGNGVLEIRRHEGVIDNEKSTVSMSTFSNSLDIDHTESGVSGSLEPDELGVLLEVVFNVGRVAQVDKASFDTEIDSNLGKVTVGTTIDIVDRDDVRARVERVDDGGGSSRSRSESKTVLGTFKSSNSIFKVLTSRVTRSGIIVSLYIFYFFLVFPLYQYTQIILTVG
jgi:hypothetical protein